MGSPRILTIETHHVPQGDHYDRSRAAKAASHAQRCEGSNPDWQAHSGSDLLPNQWTSFLLGCPYIAPMAFAVIRKAQFSARS
jgi:hypothetical protein